MRKAIAIVVLIFSFGLILNMWLHETEEEHIKIPLSKVDIYSPPSLQMYNCIEKYSVKYNIPRNYAYGIAYKETRYLGPFHWDYLMYIVPTQNRITVMVRYLRCF
jgi:hypothetical protein